MKVQQGIIQKLACAAASAVMVTTVSASTLYNSALVHYDFETLGSGGEVTDSGPNGVHLVAAGGTANLITGANGVGNGLQLPDPVILTTTGTTSDDSILNVTRDTPWTVAAWVKLSNVGDRFYIVSKVIRNVPGGSGSTDLRGWSFDISANTGKLSAIWRYDNTPVLPMTAAEARIIVDTTDHFITDTDWHHVAMTFDYDELDATRGFRIYVDGDLAAMTTTNPGLAGASDWDLSAQSSPFNLSGRYDGQLNEGGSVDDLAIWNSVLTPTEIASLVPEPASVVLMLAGALSVFSGGHRRAGETRC
ncbi:MAG: LamG domain-containing protein [Phycisphaeraceae bacterium]|nr:LamG domain-containing protein [Phycisphaeraceae bacterium]